MNDWFGAMSDSFFSYFASAFKFSLEVISKPINRVAGEQKKAPSFKRGGFWWAHLESNQAPTDYESVALTE